MKTKLALIMLAVLCAAPFAECAKRVTRAAGVTLVERGSRKALRSTTLIVNRVGVGSFAAGPAYSNTCGN